MRKFLDKKFVYSKTLLLENAVARVIKNMINKKMRKLMETLRFPCDEPFQKLVAENLNLLTASHPDKSKTIKFW